jgi:hypothetical protein
MREHRVFARWLIDTLHALDAFHSRTGQGFTLTGSELGSVTTTYRHMVRTRDKFSVVWDRAYPGKKNPYDAQITRI